MFSVYSFFLFIFAKQYIGTFISHPIRRYLRSVYLVDEKIEKFETKHKTQRQDYLLFIHYSTERFPNCIFCSQVELSHLQNAYKSLVRQKNRIFFQKLWYVVLEQFLMKYVWSGTGMVIVSLPILTGASGSSPTGKHEFINLL